MTILCNQWQWLTTMSLYSSLEETDIERIERIKRVIDLRLFLEASRDFIPLDGSLCVTLRLISTNGKRRSALLAGVHWTTWLLPRNSGFSKRNRSRTVRKNSCFCHVIQSSRERYSLYMQAVRFESARKSSAIFLFRAVHRLRSLSKSQSLHAKH